MTLVIGTDEAGYGPNLGPLVVACTAWEAASGGAAAADDLAAAAAALGRLWGDSKRVFRGGGFAALEVGALAGLTACGVSAAGWSDLVDAIAPGTEAAEWSPTAGRIALPREASGEALDRATREATATLAGRGLRLASIRCRLVQPREFNALLDGGCTKGDVLSRITLDLAAAAVPTAAGEAVVWCDRHGGRRRYAPLVARAFAAPVVQVLAETPQRSAYRLPATGCRIEFTVGGESRLPVALASMVAKYLRELSMAAFNAWWSGRVAGLRPTAGYPADAARWRRDARAAVPDSGIAWDSVWRRA